MSLNGKKLIIKNANWNAIAIGNLMIRIASTELEVGKSTKLYVWFLNETEEITVTSSDTSILTVGNKTGTGTENNPYKYDVAGVAIGDATISIQATTASRALEMTIKEGLVPSGYIVYDSIYIENGADNKCYCDFDDLQLSQDYYYEFTLSKQSAGTFGNSPFFGFAGHIDLNGNLVANGSTFALFVTNSTTPIVGWWFNGADSNPKFEALPGDDKYYKIFISPAKNGAVFESTYQENLINVTAQRVKSWVAGFSLFTKRTANGGHTSGVTKNLNIGNVKVKNEFGDLVYNLIPVKSNEDKIGYYETVTKKFYGFNEETAYYDKIKGVIEA